ncbi:hypothetical protein LOAG_16276 [Loa loa]|uniref:Uncharacterized protein n=1 Tax=Loa loa TaxID=7209 RepID=A0A1S0TDS2_LOALO|nr:hypothetical protein LOAG_16276 [Loa loa]EFO12257.1 hypothetical protein LOAG_16276 [Loa loa]
MMIIIIMMMIVIEKLVSDFNSGLLSIILRLLFRLKRNLSSAFSRPPNFPSSSPSSFFSFSTYSSVTFRLYHQFFYFILSLYLYLKHYLSPFPIVHCYYR